MVPLNSAEARDSRLGTTVSERLDMVRELSRMAWAATGRPMPEYTRAEMPLRRTTLQEQGGPHDR